MISRRALLLGSAAAVLLQTFPAMSQERCGAEAEIIALADYVTANRSKLPKLQNRRNGAISAYLKIHYQGLGPEQVEALVAPLATANVDGGRELLLSWRISAMGLEAMLAASPEAEKEVFAPAAAFSTLRAAALSGEIALLLDRIAALPQAGRSAVEMRLVQALVDIEDEPARAIAVEALSRNLATAAGGLVATHGDETAWGTFLQAVPDKARADELVNRLYWLPALRGRPPLPRKPAADAEGEMVRSLMHQVAIAAARTPERDYLMNYLNLSGDFAGASAASVTLNDLMRGGALIEMDTAWLVAFEALKAASSAPDKVDMHLEQIPFAGTRFGGSNVREAIDTMLAVEAFKAAAAGTGSAPDLVPGTSREFVVQLPTWREAAVAVGGGTDLAAFRSSGQKLAIVANLLFATGRHAELVKFLISTVPNSDSIRLAELYAEALDRRCGGHLAFQGEALTMPGTPLFRFEPQT